MIRLDKYLADMGVGTRAEVKRMIRQGKVTVDGKVEKSADRKLEAGTACVLAEGKRFPMRSMNIIC